MIKTKRLTLLPLTYDQLVKYIRADNSLEDELGLAPNGRAISPELREAFEQTILPNVADPTKDFLFHTLWTMIDKTLNTMVGDLLIVGAPNEKGEIEIGYGTYEAFKGQGYMTEAVGGIVKWAKSQRSVKAIVAGTEKANTASYTILEKNGFRKAGETDTLFTWRLDLF
jgi:RimJ/RimL family protein N-acetyltransferase